MVALASNSSRSQSGQTAKSTPASSRPSASLIPSSAAIGLSPIGEGAEQRRAFDCEFDGIADLIVALVVALGLLRELGFGLGDARFLREPRHSAAVACGDIAREGRLLRYHEVRRLRG